MTRPQHFNNLLSQTDLSMEGVALSCKAFEKLSEQEQERFLELAERDAIWTASFFSALEKKQVGMLLGLKDIVDDVIREEAALLACSPEAA